MDNVRHCRSEELKLYRRTTYRISKPVPFASAKPRIAVPYDHRLAGFGFCAAHETRPLGLTRYSGEYIVANALHYCQRTTASWNCFSTSTGQERNWFGNPISRSAIKL